MSNEMLQAPSKDFVAQEIPIALEFNGISHAVMLATPTDLEDFALGFAICEGIIDRADQFYGAEVATNCDGITVQIDIAAGCFVKLKERRRNLIGRTGCGICGTESLEQVIRDLPKPKASAANLKASSIARALRNIQTYQKLQQITGATHAAAWVDEQGQLKLIREDVGRHNALDKLIGAGLRSKHTDWSHGMLLVTSRASMEMVQKALFAGFHTLVAMSAATKMAIDLAQQNDLCLIGFARPDKWTIYSHPSRITEDNSSDRIDD